MKPVLAYDSETTGLPNWSAPSEDPSQPRITQLCAELFDDDTGEVYAHMNTLIKPEGWVIPPELEELTGVTTAKCEAVGAPMADVLMHFTSMWLRAGIRIGHNESFDMRMVRIEIMRHHYLATAEKDGVTFADFWKQGVAYCTQGNSTKIVNLPPTPKMIAAKRNHAKSPNLAEAYEFFTGKKLDGAHNASVDVAGCKAVYFGIRQHQQKLAA